MYNFYVLKFDKDTFDNETYYFNVTTALYDSDNFSIFSTEDVAKDIVLEYHLENTAKIVQMMMGEVSEITGKMKDYYLAGFVEGSYDTEAITKKFFELN